MNIQFFCAFLLHARMKTSMIFGDYDYAAQVAEKFVQVYSKMVSFEFIFIYIPSYLAKIY